ncbi:hypothetical protein PVAND_005781 [Polypedilum vanderplanki]|uniref:NADPH oxidase 5 n=1 Tax=Polypedilum vanderplanki TaxID=319348 RepID=A0A9J6C174_POLVA|nr:hypothetical protein PVAND_005781 [Polypedilum vanderplanki]
MSDNNLSVSKEELIKSEDDDSGKNTSFFDNTIDDSEISDDLKESKDIDSIMPTNEVKSENDIMKPINKSFMEMEVKRDRARWLYMSELGAIFGEEKHTRDSFMKLFCTRETLLNLFKLFDADSNESLKQDLWIELIKGRLIEEKQIDFAEQLESVTYVICGENSVTFDKFMQIWNAKGVADKFFRLIDIEGTNSVSTTQIIECISNLTNPRKKTGFDNTSLEKLEQLFRKTVGEGKEIKREDFKKIVISKNPFFTERVFQIFDKDNSGTISLQEFIDSMHQFSGQTSEDKIKFLFKVYDLDGDGLIQHEELQHVMRACMEENGMKFTETQIDDLTRAMFEDADTEQRSAITFEALTNQLTKHGGLLENLSISIDRWLVPATPENNKKIMRHTIPHQLSTPYIKNNYVYLIFMCIFVAVNFFLFVTRAYQYRKSNIFVVFARACGQCLNFNCAWVLVLMLRQTLTYLRTRGWGSFLPLDQHIYLHKLTGWLIVSFGLWHTIMHVINFCFLVVNDPVANKGNYTLTQWLFTSTPGLFGFIPGFANPTGFLLFIVLCIMFICSLPFVRRGGSFEVFYWTHLLYVAFFILVLIHGPNFWRWFLIPGVIFLIERSLRFAWMRSDRGKTYVSSGIILPSKVINLVIRRPFHFTYRPGDYVFVNVPTIAKYEWHPFTLSSAPEDSDHIGLHIRAVGEWTNRLLNFFEKEQDRLHNGEILPYDQQVHDHPNGKDTMKMQNMMKTNMCEHINENMNMDKKQSNGEHIYSEPIKSANPIDIRDERKKSLELAYNSPQNKSILQSFRYMRNKPTIIAFNTPSLEAYEQSKVNLEKDDEANVLKATEEGNSQAAAVNFPVGRPLEIYIDGPYGAPSSHIFSAQHAVLVGTGIGVTPFASILQSIMHRYWKARHVCPNCDYAWASNIPSTVMNLKKVDFFWINRDQRSFEWFVNLLSQLEIEQAELGGAMERFLDMHMYITSALQKTDMKAVSLQLALDLLHEREKRDLITGLKTRTTAGRPNWDKVFKKIQDQKKGKVTVFYCGPPQLAKTLREKCEQFGFMFRKEVF